MPRDAVSRLTLYVFLSGCDSGAPGQLVYDVRNIRLEAIDCPEFEYGWANPDPGIWLSSVGYFPEDEKTAVLTTASDAFRILAEETGACVYEGCVRQVRNARGTFQTADFSAVTLPGAYRLETGDLKSCVFEISPDLARATLWRLINFFFCLRCGTPVPGKHGMCHQDILLSFGKSGTVSSRTAYISSCVSPTASPPIAYPSRSISVMAFACSFLISV